MDPRSGEILSANIVFTSRWMRTWLKEFELWDTGLELDDDFNQGGSQSDGISVDQFQAPFSSDSASVGQLAEKLLFGTQSVQSGSNNGWDSLSDNTLIREVFSRSTGNSKSHSVNGSPKSSNSMPIESLGASPLGLSVILNLGQHASRHGRELSTEDKLSRAQLQRLLNRLMESGVKAVTMHEVGHTLGLRHNFK